MAVPQAERQGGREAERECGVVRHMQNVIAGYKKSTASEKGIHSMVRSVRSVRSWHARVRGVMNTRSG